MHISTNAAKSVCFHDTAVALLKDVEKMTIIAEKRCFCAEKVQEEM